MRRVINESTIRRMVAESVRRILEGWIDPKECEGCEDDECVPKRKPTKGKSTKEKPTREKMPKKPSWK